MTAIALSRNEVLALCTKAARGAGFGWGLAEEAGAAAAWLWAAGIDGPGVLAAHLATARDWASHAPARAPQDWRAPHGLPACPVALGAALADHADLPGGPLPGSRLALGPVAAPLLLLPFVHAVAVGRGRMCTLVGDEATYVHDLRDRWAAAATAGLGGPVQTLVLTVTDGTMPTTAPAGPPRRTTPAATVQALEALALNTTVPASAASRAGAGPATHDSD